MWDQEKLFRVYLDQDERIIKYFEPNKNIILNEGDVISNILTTLFALLFLILIVKYEITIIVPIKIGFTIVAASFVCYVLIGRFLHDAWRRSRIDYAVTEKRILIKRGNRLTSISLTELDPIDLIEHNDGTGTLQFGPLAVIRQESDGESAARVATRPAFERIGSPVEMLKFLRAQQRLAMQSLIRETVKQSESLAPDHSPSSANSPN